MKKRMMIMLCSAMLICGLSVPAMAAVSPTGTRVETPTTNKTSTAPKTGEGNLALYSLAESLPESFGGLFYVMRKFKEFDKNIYKIHTKVCWNTTWKGVEFISV